MVCCFLWKANTLQKRVKNPWVKLHNNQEPEYTRIESLSWEIQWACFTRGIAIANSFFFSTDPLMLMWSLFPKKWAVSSFDILLPTNIRKTMHPFQLQEHVAKSGPEPSRGWKNYLFSSSVLLNSDHVNCARKAKPKHNPAVTPKDVSPIMTLSLPRI